MEVLHVRSQGIATRVAAKTILVENGGAWEMPQCMEMGKSDEYPTRTHDMVIEYT
jgi:hypothetical protein